MSACTSALAPMSMPRVGSSRSRTFGSTHSIRAINTFCWLPPDSWEMFWRPPDVLIPSRAMKLG